VPAAAPVHVTSTPVASGGWLARLNGWRANAGVTALTENATWSAGDASHALYMVKNDLVTHYETPGVPYYTSAGDTAARNSNIQVSSTTNTTDDQAIDWWMAAPFHALGMLDPRLTQTGFGSYREVKSGWQEGAALDTLRGNSFTGGQYPVYFPGNNTSEPLTTYSGNESPNPLAACSGYASPTGLPVFIQVGGNVATTAGPVHSFTGNGAPLAHCVIDSTNPSFSSSLSSRGAVILIPRQPLQNGVKYVVALTVNSVPYTWSFTIGPFFSITGVSPMGGLPAGGTAVTITGSSFTGATAVKFGTSPATSFTVVNDTTITAVTPAHALGMVDVTVTTPAGTTPIVPGDQYTYSTPCTAVTLSASPASPQASGAQVTFTGLATCPSANPQYQFLMRPASQSTWQLVQAYSTSNQFRWNSIGAVAGIVYFGVWAKDASSPGILGDSSGSYDVNVSIPFTVTGTTCTAATISAAPASPQMAGTQVVFTATAATCPNPLYQFVMRPASSSTWQTIQTYSSSNQYRWNSTGAAAGTIYFGILAKDLSSPGAYDANTSISFVVSAASCGPVTISASPASPQASGTQVTFTASASGCSNPNPLYQFVMRPASSSTWQTIQAYSTGNTYRWNSTGAATGIVYFGVWAKDAGSGLAYDTTTSIPFSVNPPTSTCASVTISAAPTTVAHSTSGGTHVTVTAAATGCTSSPRYEFWIRPASSSTWQLVEAYGTTATYDWNSTGAAAGIVYIGVHVRDANSTAAYDVVNSTPVTVT
jgi:IPT/TIG domain-containing protein/cysteine-rich secretory family protein